MPGVVSTPGFFVLVPALDAGPQKSKQMSALLRSRVKRRNGVLLAFFYGFSF